MNKKVVAICVSGSLRSFEYCYKNFIEMIYNKNKDIYNIQLFYYIPDDINKTKIKLIKNLNPIVVIEKDIILPELNIQSWCGRPDNIKIDHVSTGGTKGYLQQLYGVEKSYELMSKYQKENNIKFDIIFRVRSDVLFKSPIDLTKYEMNKIYIPNFHNYNGINDRFAFGPFELMIHYMKMYTNIFKLNNINNLKILSAEHFCMVNLKNNNIPYELRDEIKFDRVRMNGKISKDC